MLFKKINDSLICFFLVVLLLLDFSYSYYQFSLAAFDGDISSIILPGESYSRVLEEPIGWPAFIDNESYPATNRYTIHATISWYFKTIPHLLQKFVSPIESIYLAASIAKLFIHIFLIGILGAYVSAMFGSGLKEHLIAAVLISVLFQTYSKFATYMTIIDGSITYALFYALPMLLLLIFLFPFYKSAITGHSVFSWWMKPVWIVLSIILVFFGALPAPVLIIVCPFTLLFLWLKYIQSESGSPITKGFNALKKINLQLLLFFSFVTIICLYSIYVGSKNSENDWWPLPLADRYERLTEGFWECFLNFRTGLLIVLIVLSINFYLLKRFQKNNSALFIKISLFMLGFSVLYILLLPLGGYRAYRPLILRWDTIFPVLMCIHFCWGTSILFLLKYFKQQQSYGYAVFISFLLITFTLTDFIPEKEKTNFYEKEALAKIASSKEDCVALERNCTIFYWAYTETCDHSLTNATMLHYWNISPRIIKYYQPEIK